MTADSVYLDGFSPQLNPEMWDEDAMKNIARHCRRGTQLATWCVAGHVRQALKAQGFEVKLTIPDSLRGTPTLVVLLETDVDGYYGTDYFTNE